VTSAGGFAFFQQMSKHLLKEGKSDGGFLIPHRLLVTINRVLMLLEFTSYNERK
jgi:hypothetical protein